MPESTISAKGQTTVPLVVRRCTGMLPGMRLIWHVMPDGVLIVRVKNRSVLKLAGVLKAPKGKHVSIDDMNAWRE